MKSRKSHLIWRASTNCVKKCERPKNVTECLPMVLAPPVYFIKIRLSENLSLRFNNGTYMYGAYCFRRRRKNSKRFLFSYCTCV